MTDANESTSASASHPLGTILCDAAAGRFPGPDGRIEVLPSLPGPVDALHAFAGHFVLSADVPVAEVEARLPVGAFTVPFGAAFLLWVAEQTGTRVGTIDALCCAPADGEGVPAWLRDEPDRHHPRVERAHRYRNAVRVLCTDDAAGVLVVGRGVCDRWEVAFEVEPHARGRGLGRRLAAAARAIVPAGAFVWAQVAPGNAASLRAVLAAGYVPVGGEVLFPRTGPFSAAG